MSDAAEPTGQPSDAGEVHRLLLAAGATLAVAESLTGGALGAALTAVPGVSATFRGGVTAYASDLKVSLLGVAGALLDDVGPVDPEVARQMAVGVRNRLGTTYGLATTGVAGPDPQHGHQPGEVYVGLAWPTGADVAALALAGDRAGIRDQTVQQALRWLARVLTEPGVGKHST